uniref:Retrovirus-related Pol polyprotein from transposon TNT 1-94 n=1 Tax=Cajanus cajan TaxID=3821 RepID=A0A151R3B9_CAJCA|nr:Retrovirus-related Pol polyprotein from transposon TNT 1-94 [Cajanus cajan]
MNDELQAMGQNQTWSIVSLPIGKTPISCRWIYKIKHKLDGTVEKYKARLVARRFSQQPGLDFVETFYPMVKITIVRVLLSLSAINNWHLAQLDINNAFLNGQLTKDIYMKIPSRILYFRS